MDAYTKELLGMAVEECQRRGKRLALSAPGVGYTADCWHATAYAPATGENRPDVGIKPTLADALAALLRDLGVEPPERPTAEQIAELEDCWPGYSAALTYRRAYARDRLAVLALLEEGS